MAVVLFSKWDQLENSWAAAHRVSPRVKVTTSDIVYLSFLVDGYPGRLFRNAQPQGPVARCLPSIQHGLQ